MVLDFEVVFVKPYCFGPLLNLIFFFFNLRETNIVNRRETFNLFPGSYFDTEGEIYNYKKLVTITKTKTNEWLK